MDLITGKGPSARHEIFYFTESTLGAVRINDYKYRFTDQPDGWLGATVKVDWPILVNLRLDPFERTGMSNGKDNGSIAYYNWFFMSSGASSSSQQEVGKYAQTFLEYPPMQEGASFNLSALKAELEENGANAELAPGSKHDHSIVKRAGRLARGGPRLHQRTAALTRGICNFTFNLNPPSDNHHASPLPIAWPR